MHRWLYNLAIWAVACGFSVISVDSERGEISDSSGGRNCNLLRVVITTFRVFSAWNCRSRPYRSMCADLG